MAYHEKLLDRAALAVGRVCIAWSRLEMNVDGLIASLSLTKEEKVEEIVMGNMDIKTKLLVAKGLAVHRNLEKQWTAECVKLLDYIDNQLRPQRNNTVHSNWFVPQGRLTRTMRKTRLRRPQSFQPLLLETEERVAIPPAKINKLAKTIEHAHFNLFLLYGYSIEWDHPEYKERQRLSWPQYLRAERKNPLPKRKRKKPSPQPKSSQGK